MLSKKPLFFLLFICLSTLHSLDAQNFTPPSEDKAVIYFTRTSSLGALINFRLYHNDEYIGLFKGKNYIRYECDPGDHLFWVSAENRSFVKANVAAGEIYVLETVPQMGAIKARVLLTPIIYDDLRPAPLRRLTKLVNNKTPREFSPEELAEGNIKFKDYIAKGMDVYQRKLESGEVRVLTADMRF